MLAKADLLIILTSVDGLMDASGKVVPVVKDIDSVAGLVRSDKGKLSVALRSPDDVRIQEGLTDVSSTVLTEAVKRADVVRGRSGPRTF